MYLDNAATTKMHPTVIKVMQECSYANYNAKYYDEALKTQKEINAATKNIAKHLGVNIKNVVFTSGATESNNMIIKGFYENNSQAHYIVSEREHKSVLAVFEYLASLGCDVTYLKTTDDVININHLIPLIKENTKFVSIMAVNNETGIINEVEEIAKYLKSRNIKFHSDCVQALGKVKINYQLFDYISLSSHKIYGPKGIGIAIVDNEIAPLIHGSSQQNNFRAGTLANELIVGFSQAINLALDTLDDNLLAYQKQRQKIITFLKENLGDDLIINFSHNIVPNIISIQIADEINQLFLKENSAIIKASTGSSCSITSPSYVLQAHNFTKEQINQTIRISLSIYDEYKIF